MHILKQSTAASVLVGPVLDTTGAVYTGAVIGDFTLTKNGTSAALASAATATHDGNGHYIIALIAGNTDTLGRAAIYCNKSTYTMAISRFSVLTAATFDALITNAAGTAGGLPLSLASNKLLVSVCDNLTNYSGNTPQTGDAFLRLGAPAGGSVSADIGAVKGDTGTILTDVNTGAGAIYTRIGSPTGASIAADIASVKTGVGSVSGAVGSVTAPVTVGGYASGQDPATLVLDATATAHNNALSIGAKINASGSASDPLANAASTYATPNSIGYILGHQLGGTFSTTSSSVFTAPSLANAPSGGGSFPTNFSALQISSGGVVAANTTQFAGVTTYAYDGVLASATSTTVTFPSADVAGNTIPDDGRYANSQIGIVGGTGVGQEVILGSRGASPLQYNVVAGTMPRQCDATSQYVLRGSTVVALDMTQAVPMSNTAGTLGDALNAARAQGFGKWTWPAGSTTITLYGPDGTTVVRTFSVDSATAPRNRT